MKSTSQDVVALFGRFLIGLLFILSGVSKAAAPSGTIAYIASSGLPLPDLGYVMALIVELGLTTLFIIGYKTRLVAGVLGIFTIVTAFAFHFQLADQNQFIHFFKNISIAGGMFQVFVFGGGALSVDGRMASRNGVNAARAA
jgi:putative oxidoreductase